VLARAKDDARIAALVASAGGEKYGELAARRGEGLPAVRSRLNRARASLGPWPLEEREVGRHDAG
ncbi:MAG: hypothetical protein M3Q65_01990, partial [Chloroflexota bacterium]|nr:hypothetical protein [Chloroflexota bacterium]